MAAAARLAKLRSVCTAHDIRPDFAAKLRQLEEFEIVAIFDDSGSMGSQCQGGGAGGGATDPFAPIPTRWSEAMQHASITVEVATCLDVNGIDIRFLNRPGVSNVVSTAQVAAVFEKPPNGNTPLTRAIRAVFEEKKALLVERKLLLVILTDGEPTDDKGAVRRDELVQLLRGKPDNLYVSIVACTDDASVMTFLDSLDKGIPRVDVVDDFESEKAQILAVQGASFRFNFGDYVVKTLLGPVDEAMDLLDEVRLAPPGGATVAPTATAPPAAAECEVCMDKRPDTAFGCGHVLCRGELGKPARRLLGWCAW